LRREREREIDRDDEDGYTGDGLSAARRRGGRVQPPGAEAGTNRRTPNTLETSRAALYRVIPRR
jgi:hypothetical protein